MKPGFVVIGPTGRILVSGFDVADAASCREAGTEAMLWARDQIQAAIDQDFRFAVTGDSSRDVLAMDFSADLSAALLSDEWLMRDVPKMTRARLRLYLGVDPE